MFSFSRDSYGCFPNQPLSADRHWSMRRWPFQSNSKLNWWLSFWNSYFVLLVKLRRVTILLRLICSQRKPEDIFQPTDMLWHIFDGVCPGKTTDSWLLVSKNSIRVLAWLLITMEERKSIMRPFMQSRRMMGKTQMETRTSTFTNVLKRRRPRAFDDTYDEIPPALTTSDSDSIDADSIDADSIDSVNSLQKKLALRSKQSRSFFPPSRIHYNLLHRASFFCIVTFGLVSCLVMA